MAKKKTSKKKKITAKEMAHKPEAASSLSKGFERSVDFLLKFERFGRDVGGVVLIVMASLTLLALIGLTSGAWLNPWAAWLRRWFGVGSIFIVAAFAVGGLFMIRKQQENFSAQDWRRVIWLELSAFSIMALLSIIRGTSLVRAEDGMDGGLIGWGIAEFLGSMLKSFPEGINGFFRIVILLAFFGLGILFGFGLFGKVILKLEEILKSASESEKNGYEEEQPAVSVGEMKEQPNDLGVGNKTTRRKKTAQIPAEHRKKFKVEAQVDERVLAAGPRDDRLPPLDILLSGDSIKPSQRHINQTAGLIEKTLAEFGVPAKVVGFKVGPTITQFAVEPGYVERSKANGEEGRQKVRVSQISALQRDLALALSAERLRIQAPVPGRSYLGIEVPNKKSIVVRLKSILQTEVFHNLGSPLSIALGRDVSGHPVVADLIRMPHLLIAGTTGSGKSVCIASITSCLVMNNTPEDLRIIMIDPKMVELVRFNGMPHLLGKVETNLERISGVLRWVVAEMQRRYKLLEELKARDIETYNRKVRRRKDFEHLPRIVVLIDELADLMMMAAEQTEATLVRLAQMARATGIHLVIATQRPSADVVTGLIKANFPARISFAVASGIDSRVILDYGGAEMLLGKGDMLFLNPEEGAPVRTQGVLVSDKEIEKIITYWQESWPDKPLEAPWDVSIREEAILADRDDLVEQAVEFIQESGRASTSMMQRRLRVGYPRAARLMDELEDMGIVGPSLGGGREREILIDLDEEEG